MKKSLLAISIIFIVLALDQALKIWVKTSFCYGEERAILGLSWAKLNFVENPGMAFGWKLGGEYGKLALSVFRLIAISFLIYYITLLIKRKVSTGLIASFSLILAGAMGNIIDSAFYGMIFSESPFHYPCEPAQMFPEEGGYGKFLHGRVVDMLFFPLWKNELGEVQFFQPVFNIADTAITVGVLSILLFQRRYFNATNDLDNPAPHTTVLSQNLASDTQNSENTEGGILTENSEISAENDSENTDLEQKQDKQD